MFDPYLTCQAFGIVNGPNNCLLELARSWSRLSYLDFESDGSVQWDSEAALEVRPDLWRAVPSHINLSTHNALLHLGDFDDGVAVIAFVSSLPVVSAGFRDAAPWYLGKSHPTSKIIDIFLHLDQIAKHSDKFVIRAVDGTAPEGLRVTYRVDRSSWETGIKQIPNMKQFHAIEIAAGEQTARLEANYSIRLSGVSIEPHTIISGLKSLFDNVRSFTTRIPP